VSTTLASAKMQEVKNVGKVKICCVLFFLGVQNLINFIIYLSQMRMIHKPKSGNEKDAKDLSGKQSPNLFFRILPYLLVYDAYVNILVNHLYKTIPLKPSQKS